MSAKNDKYISIKKALESKEVDTEIAFLLSIKPVFDEFMTKFQRQEPMIHLLHPNCEKLLKTTMARLMKSKVYTDKKGKVLKEVDVEDLSLQLNSDRFKSMQVKKISIMHPFLLQIRLEWRIYCLASARYKLHSSGFGLVALIVVVSLQGQVYQVQLMVYLKELLKEHWLGMKSFYRAVIKDLQKMMPIEETLLKALTCLNPMEQKEYILFDIIVG